MHERVARRFVDEELTPVLDVGCGEGELARHLPAHGWVGVDASVEMLARAPEPHYKADATALPFPDGSFSSVALLYVLYHSPELASALPRAPPTFDAELVPELLAEQFAEVEVERWDAALLELPTRVAVRDYLIGKGVEPVLAGSKAETVPAPLSVTKRGALAFARKRCSARRPPISRS